MYSGNSIREAVIRSKVQPASKDNRNIKKVIYNAKCIENEHLTNLIQKIVNKSQRKSEHVKI
jgi:hypothetical protein